MLVDLGSRDARFLDIVKTVRNDLLALGGVSQADGYECVLMQGSGTFGVEAVLSSALPRDGGLLIVSNGAYGKRMIKMAETHQIEHAALDLSETATFTPEQVRDAVAAASSTLTGGVSHVAVVHHETTTGCLNRLEGLRAAIDEGAKAGSKPAPRLIVDSMSAFGA